MSNLYEKIYGDLIAHGNKEIAENDKKYHKYDGHRSLGIRAPVRDKLFKKYKRKIKKLSCKEALSLAQMFYKNRIEKMMGAGHFVLQNKNEYWANKNNSFVAISEEESREIG